MELTELQKEMLDGKYGKGASMAMQIQCAVGEGFEAERMVPVSRVHVSLSAQDSDIWFAEKMADAGAYCRVRPTVNPGYNCEYFSRKKILNEEQCRKMARTQSAYQRLGAILNYSCTPYLFENIPHFGENIAFSETSATVYVNSVLGARSNRESAASALCAGITGFVPEYGMLLEKNRKGKVLIKVEAQMENVLDYGLLGLAAGKETGYEIPVFQGLGSKVSESALIMLGAQLNVSGTCAMFHIPQVTPEAPDLETAFGQKKAEKEIRIGKRELEQVREEYSCFRKDNEKVEYVILGCPHYNYERILQAAEVLNGRRCRIPVIILTSAGVMGLAEQTGLLQELKKSGVDLVSATCVDEKCCFEYLKDKLGATDSHKALYYMSSFGIRMMVCSMEECLQFAVEEEQ